MTFSITRRNKPLMMDRESMSGNQISHTNNRTSRTKRPNHIKVRLHPCLRKRIDDFCDRDTRNLTNAVNLLLKEALDARDALLESKDAS